MSLSRASVLFVTLRIISNEIFKPEIDEASSKKVIRVEEQNRSE